MESVQLFILRKNDKKLCFRPKQATKEIKIGRSIICEVRIDKEELEPIHCKLVAPSRKVRTLRKGKPMFPQIHNKSITNFSD
jgi:hypothetical protein